jgi:DNA-binding NarL/FixJ family response regulator
MVVTRAIRRGGTVLSPAFCGHDEPGIARQLRRPRNTVHAHIKRLYE